jgi:protein phosphatase 1 regulatory subunit 7
MQQQNRIGNPANLDLDYIDKEIQDGKHLIVQFSEDTYTDDKLSIINGLCKKYDMSFGVRFYGHDSSIFDCKILLKLPEVKCLYVDCLLNADNVLTLTHLHKLQKLSLGVYELTETEILNSENFKQLTQLILTETKTKALNLDYLKEYRNLKYLILGGHTKNISSVGNLSGLEYLSLNSIKKTSVEFVNKLKRLRTLKFILGGRENIHEIENNEIEHLEIIWVRGFNDLANIKKFKKLEYLNLEHNFQLEKIHFDEEMPSLKRLKISNCKKLTSLTGLQNLTSLDRIGIYQTNIDFQAFIKQQLPKSLKAIRFYTSKIKLNDKIKLWIRDKGYTD